jgi:hypothetical protein
LVGVVERVVHEACDERRLAHWLLSVVRVSCSFTPSMHTALLAQEDQPARMVSIARSPVFEAQSSSTHLNFFSGFEYPDCAMVKCVWKCVWEKRMQIAQSRVNAGRDAGSGVDG